MVDRDAILARIQALLATENDILIPVVDLPETTWQETGLTSLALMQLVLDLEGEYACTITNEVLRDVRTFGDLATLIQREAVCDTSSSS